MENLGTKNKLKSKKRSTGWPPSFGGGLKGGAPPQATGDSARPIESYTQEEINIAKGKCEMFSGRVANIKVLQREKETIARETKKSQALTCKQKKVKEKFQGKQTPDPSTSIRQFLESEYSQNIEKKMADMYEKKQAPMNGKEFKEYSNYTALRISMQNGNRKEAYQKITLKSVMERTRNVPISKACAILKANQTEREEDLAAAHIEATQGNKSKEKNQSHGYSMIQIPFHKTSLLYDLWVLINKAEDSLLNMYEQIRFSHLTVNLEETKQQAQDINRPFLLNSRGQALITSSKGIDCSEFGNAIGQADITAATFRYSNFFLNVSFSLGKSISQCWMGNIDFEDLKSSL